MAAELKAKLLTNSPKIRWSKTVENEFIITRDIVEKFRLESFVDTFNKVFPDGAKVTDIPKLISHIDGNYYYRLFVQLLLNELPFNNKILVVDGNTCENLFYNGDIRIEGNAKVNRIYIKGNLVIDGNLIIKDKGEIIARNFDNKKQIIATEINLGIDSMILAHVKAKNINVYSEATIIGNVDTNTVNLDDSEIWGNVEANKIINNAGVIDGDVNTVKIENINDGTVTGKITYKNQ